MKLDTIENQAIALAGLSQACWLVNQLASLGQCDTLAMASSLSSILKIDADSVEEVFGGINGIKFGLIHLDRQLGKTPTPNQLEIRYAGQLISLQKQLSKNPSMQATIRNGITRAQAQNEHFDILHENLLANFADLYFSTISNLQPRIMVIGDQQYLNSANNVNRIRSLLLAGIRAAMLWDQCGGRRWQLPFIRHKLHQQVQVLLNTL
ncbi:MAG: lysogenization regulator HflD [Methylococcaceae bacterium]|nr:lysogenization regulator HflD [Methylococcaceae bacterium]